jgi:hypothetical protein
LSDICYDFSTAVQPALFGSDGELVMVRVSVDPRHLEELLEVLASLDFPVNPELLHKPGAVTIEFPAYESHVRDLRKTLIQAGFERAKLDVFGMLAAAAAGN